MTTGQVAVVTGAARGLGLGIARRLHREGWRVALVDVAGAAEAAAALDGEAATAIGITGDVSDPDSCLAVVDEVIQRLGTPSGLVNNAGIGGPSTPVHETPVDEFRRVLDVNLLGAFLMARAVVPAMLAAGNGGAIVNITSVLGQRAEAGSGAYSASKAGLALLGQSMALELADAGIRVNSVAPGNMLTEMHREHVEGIAERAGTSYDEALAGVRATIPIGRHGTPDDIGDVVAWLLSSDSSYVTGQTVAVNGGILLT